MDSPANGTPIGFKNLPREMTVAVLRQLNLPDLINCRRVSKHFRLLIDSHLKIRELNVFDFNRNTLFAFDFFPTFKYQLQQSNSDLLRSASFKSFLSANLRTLTVCSLIKTPCDLNEFSSLERLYAWSIKFDQAVKLSLPNLRILFISSISFKPTDSSMDAYLTIDSKVLETMDCNSFARIKLVHCDTMRAVSIGRFRIDHPALTMFKRLQILKMIPDHELNEQLKSVILAFQDLTELHFNWCPLISEESMRLLIQTIQHIWTEKPALRIFWFGVQLTSQNSHRLISRILFNLEELFVMHIENYQHLNASPMQEYVLVYYDQLVNFENRTLPVDFFARFSNIRSVLANVIENSDRFVSFVNSCQYLKSLRLSIAGLDRLFFDRLSLNRLTLRKLALHGQNPEIHLAGFIHRLDYLMTLEVDQELDCRTVISFFDECRHLEKFTFKADNKLFIAARSKERLYKLIRSIDFRNWSDISYPYWVKLCRLIFNEGVQTRSRDNQLKIDLDRLFLQPMSLR